MELKLKLLKPTQRKLNWSQLKDKTFYRSNAVLGFFYIFTLLTTIICFARTVALQTGRWALLQGDLDSVPKIVLSKLAPNYMDEDMINTRSCLKTINHINIPTPFNKSCLNDVEIGIESQLIKPVWLIWLIKKFIYKQSLCFLHWFMSLEYHSCFIFLLNLQRNRFDIVLELRNTLMI